MFRFPAILFGFLTAFPAMAELLPLGDWPVDATRATLQIDQELFRNCGRVLERWDVAVDPPVLLDSLVLDSPPVDLLDWDGLLLVQRDDGVLEARDRTSDWGSPIWELDVGTCATQLVRHGNLLLPMGQGEVRLVDMALPSSPVVLPHFLGEGIEPAYAWGGEFAASVDGHLVGQLDNSCGLSWESLGGAFHMELDSAGQATNADLLDGIDWQYSTGSAAAAAGGVLVAGQGKLDWVGPPSWQVEATLPFSYASSTLAAQDHDGWVSQHDSLFHILVDPLSDTPLGIAHRVAVPGGRDVQLLPDRLLVTGPSGNTWLETQGDPQPVGELAAPGSVQGMAWAGGRLLMAQDGLRMLTPSGGVLETTGFMGLEAAGLLDAEDELCLVQLQEETAVIHWPAGGDGQQVASLPTRSRGGLQLGGSLALTCDSDTLTLWDLATPAEPYPLGFHVESYIHSPKLAGNRAVAHVANVGLRLFRLYEDGLEEGALLPDDSYAFDFVGPWLVVGVFERGTLHLKTYDVENPLQPMLRHDQTLPEDVWNVQLEGGSRRLALHMLENWHIPIPGTTYLDTYRYDEQAGWLRTGRQQGLEVGSMALSDDEMGGRLAASLPGFGVQAWLDDSVLPIEPLPVRPRALVLSAAPNPFNPVTRLSFTLERPGAARLAVFDLRGREVARPAARDFAAGTHEVTFDASALASGLYLARLEAEGRTAVAKLALVR
jgi:hypothetical protein